MSTDRRSLIAIFVAACNAALSMLALLAGGEYSTVARLATVSFFLFAVLCVLEAGNLLFLARTLILGAVGYFAIVVKVLLGPDALFSGYERSTQGFDVVITMYVVTSLALLSNQLGLTLAKRHAPTADERMAAAALSRERRSRILGRIWISRWWIAGMAGLPLALFSSYAFIRGYGQSILQTSYGTQGGVGLPFGSVGILGAIGIFSIAVAGFKGHLKSWKPVLLIASFAFMVRSQLLMGLRQDTMSVLFGLLILYGVVNGRELRLRLIHVPLLLAAYAFFEVWGVARDALAYGIPLRVMVSGAFTFVNAADIVTLGTFSPIATTFSNTVYMIQHQWIDFSWGRSYFEWLLRIPPEALYPNRPRDYAFMFEEHGLISGGGFFELAEVYMNFGLAGALIIPGVISLLLGRTYYHALRSQSVFSYFLLFSFLSIFLRGTWYQTFAFFRAAQVSLLLYLGYAAVVELLRCARADHLTPHRERPA